MGSGMGSGGMGYGGMGSGMGKEDKAGTYRLMMEMNLRELPDFCKDGCIYTKDRDVKNTKYCFKRSSSYAAECDAEGGHGGYGGYGGERPRPVYDCQEEDIAYTQPEEPKEERNVESWADCQEMCSNDEKCNFWSYNQRERTCLMMKAFGREERETGTTSGPKKCYDCQQEGTAYEPPSEPREEKNVETWSECQKMCRKDERCNFWTYDEREKTCFMMKAFEREEKKEGSTSGEKRCPVYDCQEDGTVYEKPEEPKVERSIEDWSKCQKMCRDDERCNFWTFEEREETCTMMKAFDGKDAQQGAVSGPKRCKVYDCYDEGTGVEPADAIDPKEERNVENWSECQKMCLKNEQCNFWSYNGREKICMMMRAIIKKTKQEGAFSGPKECTDRIQ